MFELHVVFVTPHGVQEVVAICTQPDDADTVCAMQHTSLQPSVSRYYVKDADELKRLKVMLVEEFDWYPSAPKRRLAAVPGSPKAVPFTLVPDPEC